MIRRLKTDIIFHLRKRPVTVAGSCCCLCGVLLIIIMLYQESREVHEKVVSDDILMKSDQKTRIVKDKEAINIFIIVCKQKQGDQLSVAEESARQVIQAATLLKTIYFLTDSDVNVIILNNDVEVFSRIRGQLEEWEMSIGQHFRVSSRKVFYPPGLREMQNMFRVCATARLFMHEMLPNIDSGIFLDTDIILMDDIQNLQDHFQKFNPAQIMGMAAVEPHYSNVQHVEHYGPPGVGLNAGVILMNLTRMRLMSGGGFTGTVRYIFAKHQSYLPLADQDILNAIYGSSPWYLYELPCSWNYIVWQCREDLYSESNPRSWIGKNQCPDSALNGVSLLHGVSVAFFTNLELIFRTIFEYWTKFQMRHQSLLDSSRDIRLLIRSLVDREDDASLCAKVPGIEDMIVKRLEKVLEHRRKSENYSKNLLMN